MKEDELPDREIPPAERARGEAWKQAVKNAGGYDRSTSDIRHTLMRQAEMAVLRRLVSQHLDGGEVTYWKLVLEELSTP